MKVYSTIIIFSLLIAGYMVYSNFYVTEHQVAREVVAQKMDTVTEKASAAMPVIDSIFDKLIKLIQSLSPILAPIFTFKYRNKMDGKAKKVLASAKKVPAKKTRGKK